MRKLCTPRRSEASIQEEIRRILEADGFLVEKTHGNQFQPGFPDLYCFKKPDRHVWVEVKRPGGKLTSAQVKRFTTWEAWALPVFVVDKPSRLWSVLAGPPNWRSFKAKGKTISPKLPYYSRSRGVSSRRGPSTDPNGAQPVKKIKKVGWRQKFVP